MNGTESRWKSFQSGNGIILSIYSQYRANIISRYIKENREK